MNQILFVKNCSDSVLSETSAKYDFAIESPIENAIVSDSIFNHDEELSFNQMGDNGRINTIPVNPRHATVVYTNNPADKAKCKLQLALGTPKAGATYTVIISKHGTVANERYRWTYSTIISASDTTGSAAATDLMKQINASSEGSGITATVTGSTVVVEAVKFGDDYSATYADDWASAALAAGNKIYVTNVNASKLFATDTEFVKKLYQKCVGNKGINYLGEDGKDIYPNYPEPIFGEYSDTTKWHVFTLRFANPRLSSKQRDELVWQNLYIVTPVAAAVTKLKTLLGLTNATE